LSLMTTVRAKVSRSPDFALLYRHSQDREPASRHVTAYAAIRAHSPCDRTARMAAVLHAASNSSCIASSAELGGM
jgi:hypothetical protein